MLHRFVLEIEHASPRGQIDKLVLIKAELMICSKMLGNDVFTTPTEVIFIEESQAVTHL